MTSFALVHVRILSFEISNCFRIPLCARAGMNRVWSTHRIRLPLSRTFSQSSTNAEYGRTRRYLRGKSAQPKSGVVDLLKVFTRWTLAIGLSYGTFVVLTHHYSSERRFERIRDKVQGFAKDRIKARVKSVSEVRLILCALNTSL